MFDKKSGMWWSAEAGEDGTLEEPCGKPTSAEPSAETVLLLSSLLSAERNEPNTRLEHVLACVESVPSLVTRPRIPVALQADFCFRNLVTGSFAKNQPTAPCQPE